MVSHEKDRPSQSLTRAPAHARGSSGVVVTEKPGITADLDLSESAVSIADRIQRLVRVRAIRLQDIRSRAGMGGPELQTTTAWIGQPADLQDREIVALCKGLAALLTPPGGRFAR